MAFAHVLSHSVAFALCCALLLVTGVSASGGEPKTYRFKQKLDHLTKLPGTWQQRYQVTDDWYNGSGPVFLFLSGEAPMEFFAFQTVQIRKWAEQFGALYVNLEHRFYGESLPLGAPGWGPLQLELLSSKQALADAAFFLQSYNKTLLGPHGPWIVFGCSYSGALSAWFRTLYPKLVVASIAPSGPVLAQSNFTTFFGQFSNSAAPTCVDVVRETSSQIQELAKTPAGLQQLSSLFNSCTPLDQKDVFYFLWTVMSAVGSADQMNNPPTWILNTTCNLLTNSTNQLAGYAAAFEFNQNQAAAAAALVASGVSGPTVNMRTAWLVKDTANQCNSFSESQMIAGLQQKDNPNRAWWWQKCTEFGFFKPGYTGTSAFFTNLPVEHIVAYCGQIFGKPGLHPDIDGTNLFYGGKSLNGSSILFSNGLLDPWHLLSITEPTQPGVQSVTYEAGHCAPLTADSSIDPPSLTLAREKMGQFLASHL